MEFITTPPPSRRSTTEEDSHSHNSQISVDSPDGGVGGGGHVIGLVGGGGANYSPSPTRNNINNNNVIINRGLSSPVSSNKDVERYVKFFLIKATQVIVQSRLSGGRKVKSECKVLTAEGGGQADWFNLHIPEDEFTERILHSIRPRLHILQHRGRSTFTIATTLHYDADPASATTPTKDDQETTSPAKGNPTNNNNNVLPLEIWRFTLDLSNLDSAGIMKDIYNLYNRLGLMLKSIICVTRSTPGYNIARKQSEEVKILYELRSSSEDNKENNEGEGEEGGFHVVLGEKYKTVNIGKVPLTSQTHHHHSSEDLKGGQSPTTQQATPPTPSIEARLFYRTKMELLTSNYKSSAKSLLIKSDHYGDGVGGGNGGGGDRSCVRPAFVICDEVIKVDDDEDGEEEGRNPFFKIHKKPKDDKDPGSPQTPTSTSIPEVPIKISKPSSPIKSPTTTIDFEPSITLPFAPTSLPFNNNATTGSGNRPLESTQSSNNSDSELLTLFEEFRVAPPLQAFEVAVEEVGVDSSGSNAEEELAVFETEINLYDEFVKKLSEEE